MKRLYKELKSLKKELAKYKKLFKADGTIDKTEKMLLNHMIDLIHKCEEKLKSLKKKKTDKKKKSETSCFSFL